ncbi:hypothetical protein DFP72DRAFT_844448 [Ephemerocybe angulata]|uniref:Uncharacterized protein n=1 Tax=Ephemerocybe angulata TaxID=980116 RepID=A0A8H6I5J7_9AGAR|nr:hypothetical protein DFP72DRAFT_844448 [Tulosesus angulatus]
MHTLRTYQTVRIIYKAEGNPKFTHLDGWYRITVHSPDLNSSVSQTPSPERPLEATALRTPASNLEPRTCVPVEKNRCLGHSAQPARQVSVSEEQQISLGASGTLAPTRDRGIPTRARARLTARFLRAGRSRPPIHETANVQPEFGTRFDGSLLEASRFESL